VSSTAGLNREKQVHLIIDFRLSHDSFFLETLVLLQVLGIFNSNTIISERLIMNSLREMSKFLWYFYLRSLSNYFLSVLGLSFFQIRKSLMLSWPYFDLGTAETVNERDLGNIVFLVLASLSKLGISSNHMV
jgi:hypothetical protein